MSVFISMKKESSKSYNQEEKQLRSVSSYKLATSIWAFENIQFVFFVSTNIFQICDMNKIVNFL